ncbi:MBL fold metallo-hydrolase [Ottowia sp.]|uniref:MBL fold metallo-hydrolase n=1 Tax=Ottowia sp. TaxID=1898956 RepID=UPI0039E68E68
MADQLDYPLADAPGPGQSVEIAPGVLWLRMPMPFALTHINLWALRDGDGCWSVVDTGLHTVETTAAWRMLLSAQGPLHGARITRVLATHMHPDHVGMAGWLGRRFDCALWMTQLEYLNCRMLISDTGREAPADGVRFYQRAGWSEADQDNYRARFGGFGKMIHPLPDSFVRLSDGQSIRIGEQDWKVVVGRGHSPEHACLYCAQLGLFISGDQVLPRISSNVSVYPTEPGADPLADWLSTLDQIRLRVPDDVLVLPAHNEPFRGLHLRLSQLERGVLQGLDRLREQLRQPRRAIDVFGALFRRPIDDHQLFSLATGEALAHINYLLRRNEAVLHGLENGVAWYRLSH